MVQAEVYQPCSLAPSTSQYDRVSVTPARVTEAERLRNYRAKKIDQQLQNNPYAILTLSPVPLTNAEHAKNYRERQKLNLETESNNFNIADCLAANIENNLNTTDDNGFQNSLSSENNPFNRFSSTNDYDDDDVESWPYPDYGRLKRTHQRQRVKIKFFDNSFGHACSVCDRLWFQRDLKSPSSKYQTTLNSIIPNIPTINILLCSTYRSSLSRNNIPTMATCNGFKYPDMPNHLPPLDLISERLISPRIPFMAIRRLRHCNGQYGVYGQIINVLVSVDTMVYHLPRDIDDDHSINVHIKSRTTHKSSYLHGLIKKRTIKVWLYYLIPSPLYRTYNIKVNLFRWSTTE